MKTKQYDMFIFREDNRAAISQNHVSKLVESIKSRNLLELRPIIVNEKMEILDGQHRLLAAKALAVDIYYEIKASLRAEEVLILNTNKPWGIADYLNYYATNQYPEYLKLKDFVKAHNMQIRVALHLCVGSSKNAFKDYKEGKFVFNSQTYSSELQIVLETIDFIRKMNGYSNFTNSATFWKAMIHLSRQPNFDEQKWKFNLTRFVERIVPKSKEKDYINLFISIHNWKNQNKIIPKQEELECDI